MSVTELSLQLRGVTPETLQNYINRLTALMGDVQASVKPYEDASTGGIVIQATTQSRAVEAFNALLNSVSTPHVTNTDCCLNAIRAPKELLAWLEETERRHASLASTHPKLHQRLQHSLDVIQKAINQYG